MWVPQVGPTVDPRDPQVGYGPHRGPRRTQPCGSHKWAPLWTHGTHKWVPPYVGPTKPIICGAYYIFFKQKKSLNSDKINPHSAYVAPHKTL